MTIEEERIDSFRTELLEAFGDLEPPDFSQAIRSLELSPDSADESPLFRELSGKRWLDLEAAYLEKRWSHFGYLDAEAYRYYLPALLYRCLEDLSPDNSLLHPTLFMLRPSFSRLYRYGEDGHFKHRTSIFSETQYRAVCSFLALNLGSVYQKLAASAIRWGWNQCGRPAIAEVNDLYERWHSYRYAPVGRPEIAGLVEQIESAFAATPYPGDDHICDPRPGDEEVAEYALEFRGASWNRLHPEFLAYHDAAISFFTPQAFRHFLPAYLIAELRAPDTEIWLNSSSVFHLSYGLVEMPTLSDAQIEGMIAAMKKENPELEIEPQIFKPIEDPGAYDRAIKRFSTFSLAEREAIVAYLQYAAENDPYERPRIEEALEKYWLGSLG
jgi:hypothetical protein